MRQEGNETEIVDRSAPDSVGAPSAPKLHPRVLERYDVGRCLGVGTFGVVYEARERAGGTSVALKRLAISDAAAVHAFKQEFRALVDVVHENLVRLDELFSFDEELYLSMELVLGEGFLDYVRPAAALDPQLTSRPTAALDVSASPPGDRGSVGAPPTVPRTPVEAEGTIGATSAQADAQTPAGSDESGGGGPLSGARARPAGQPDHGRLRAALRQLAQGVLAIHRANKLHRDIKPSNVLVSASARVVILDFGLVTAPGPRRERRVMGTPAYMSPEQARGVPLGAPSDWYAVGVMLFEALTGALPYEGDARTIMRDKQALDAPDPRTRALDVPDDLAELCLGLLRRDPRERTTGPELLRVLGGDGERGIGPDLGPAPLIGRDLHLQTLEEAYSASRGQAVTVLVLGASGMGKTALCHRFLAGLVEAHGALVLEGRCYERELVPYKALDALVDALTDYLAALPRDQADALLPADTPALARLFPVLRRAPAVAAVSRVSEPLDPQEARRRAAFALRRLLTRVAEAAPLVLAIDDLQWGDADSASLLLDVLAPPDPPRLLLLAGYRSEDASAVHLAAALHRQMAHGEPVGDVRELWVGPLGDRDARALVRALLPASSSAEGDLAEDPTPTLAIVREAAGSPFIVQELCRHVRAHGGDEASISLGDVLGRRIARLPAPARELLSVIAVAGQPIAVEVAGRAAGVTGRAALSILRAESLVKIRAGGPGVRAVEPYHDRLREAALAGLGPGEVARHSLALAFALEEAGSADSEALLVYFEAGGDIARARACAEAAAVRAEEALAFDRAAALYRRALDGAPAPQALRVKLAAALANAGRGAEAGRVYLEAARSASVAGAGTGEALDLRRLSAEQFLRGGHVDEGLAAVRDVLDAVGLSLPETPARAFASLLYRRARLSLRGLEYEEHPQVHSHEELTRIDVCWSVGNGLRGVDPVRSADFQARHLLYALQAGEPYRIAIALASESVFAAMEGGEGGRARADALIYRAVEISERIDHLHAVAWSAAAQAAAAFYDHRLRDAVELSDRALALFRDTRGDVVWELGSIICWLLLPSLYYLGRFDEIERSLPAYLKEAEDLGALYNVTCLRTLMLPRLLLSQDRPAEARRESAAALARWSYRHGFTAQHCCDLYTRAHVALYLGDGPGAEEEIAKSAADLQRSQLLRVELVRIDATYMRGAAAVAAAPIGPEGARRLKVAERDARTLVRMDRPYAQALGRALGAAVALERGELDRAAALYAEAGRAFDVLEMALHAAAMRWRRGQILLGEEGRGLIDGADALLREQGVVRPDRMVAMLAPLRG